MHEMSIAQSIIEILLEEVPDPNSKIQTVILKTGVLQQILPESLTFYYDILKNDYEQLKDSQLLIEEEKIKGKCMKCEKIYIIENLFFLCPNCNTGVEILQGNEIYIEKIIL